MSVLRLYPGIIPLDISFYQQKPYCNDRFRRGKLQILLGALCQSSSFLGLDVARQTEIVMLIERGCMNATVTKAISINLIPTWDNETFSRMYSILVIEVAEALDWRNHRFLAIRLLKGTVNPQDIGSMSTDQLVPETGVARLVEMRRNAKILEKTTSLYTCSQCGKKEATFFEVQIRGGDEGKDTYLICTYCGREWVEKT